MACCRKTHVSSLKTLLSDTFNTHLNASLSWFDELSRIFLIATSVVIVSFMGNSGNVDETLQYAF